MTSKGLAKSVAAFLKFFMDAVGLTAEFIFLLFVFLDQGSALAQNPTQTATPNRSQNSDRSDVFENDLVHYGDIIDIDVLGSIDGDWRGTVDPEGFLQGLIYAPDPVYALCKTEKAIELEIASQYSRTLKDPKVVVRILDRSGRAATLLLGAVRNQQRFKLRREVRLNELLDLSGGITDTASGVITVARPVDLNCFSDKKDQKMISLMKFTISEVLSGDAKYNPSILSGDIITVVEASPIYVIGGVNTPRQISSREEMTVSRAVSSAGGLAKEAVESDVTVYRRDEKGAKSINVDLKKIRSKQQDDLLLKPFDIVDVGQKGRGKPKFPPSVSTEPLNRDIYKLPIRIVE